jgi:putative transposase
VPILAEEGRYLASESTFYRLLREEGLLRQRARARRRRTQEPEELKATAVNQLWSWDITYLKTGARGKYYFLYLFMDVFSRAIMGWEIHEEEDGAKAAALLDALCQRWGASGVTLRSDNGAPMRSSHMLGTLQRLGVIPSFSRPSVSNDNPYSESLFKTLKYTAGYPTRFLSIEQARTWMTGFACWYNEEHRHSRIRHVTPMQRHMGRDCAILAKREETYAAARLRHPERFRQAGRSWSRPAEVVLRRPNHRPQKKSAA